MKLLNKNKIVVSALALAIGASLVGSVSGTIAWYQYSTRANVSFIGKSGGFSGNLQMRFVSEASNDNAWRTRITWQEMNNELAATGYATKIVPMTFGGMDKDAAFSNNGYIQPRLGVANMTKWYTAKKANYAQFELQLRYNERDGVAEGDPAVDAKNVAKDVYLTNLLIQQDANNGTKDDLSNAVRVHIKSTDGTNVTNKLISNLGKDIATKGKLDLDGDGKLDQAYPDENDEFGFDYVRDDSGSMIYDNSSNPTRVGLTDVVYGEDNDNSTEERQYSYNAKENKAVQGVKYTQEECNEYNTAQGLSAGDAGFRTIDDWKTEPVYPALVYSENNYLYNDSTKASTPDVSKSIGKTVVGSSDYLTVTVTIWVEGWQPLDGSAIWDTKYINSSFNVGIQFAVQDELQAQVQA